MRWSSWSWVGVLVLLALACGDDKPAAKSCPDAAAVGALLACECADGGMGQQLCKAGSTLSDCDCAFGVGTGGSSGAASGSGGTGAGGSSTTGTPPGQLPDAGMSPPVQEQDAGPGNNEAPPVELPTDGNQLAVCETDRDCSMNFGCYASGPGVGYCTIECAVTDDCMSLADGVYACGQSGLCSAQCQGTDDSASCPSGMQCLELGSADAFRCQYPDPAEQPASAFGPCMRGSACAANLECIGTGMSATGFCSHACTPDNADCSDLVPSTGTLEPICEPQGPMLGVCALDCSDNGDGCPDGMQCVTQGFYQLCGYAQ